MGYPFRANKVYYVNDVADLPSNYILEASSVYYITASLDLGSGAISLPDDSYVIGLSPIASITSTNSNPISGNDWKFRVYGVYLNGTLQGIYGLNMPVVTSYDLISATVPPAGSMVWVSDIESIAVKKTTHWVDLSTDKKILALLHKEDWESGVLSSPWYVANDAFNQWIVAPGFADTGTYSAFISNDGVNPAYTMNKSTNSHLYRDFSFPGLFSYFEIRFRWRGEMEIGKDYGRVYLAPTTFTPNAGSSIGTSYQIGDDEYNNSYTFTDAVIPLTGISGIKRLIFSFICNNKKGTPLSWIIDNIEIWAA